MTKAKVVLVGGDQQENLALQYLASSLENAGFEAIIVGFNDAFDAPKVLAQVARSQPLAVGIALQFQYAINPSLELAKAIRDAGFTGHITGGGHVPTFCWREILRDSPAFDSLVIHEGEQTLVDLVRSLVNGDDWCNVAGVASRRPSEPEVRIVECNLNAIAWPKRAPSPFTVAGLPIAFLLTARGCVGECAYCSIRAFAHDAGGPPFRVRGAEDVARELASLRHQKGIKTFFLQDDLFIVPPEHRALDHMRELKKQFDRQGLDDVCFWIKGRPESITPAVVAAAKDLNALHLFLGVENDSDDRLKYLGRYHRAHHNREAISRCREAGIMPSFNIMLFDPDCTLDDVKKNVVFLREHLDLAWNICRTEIYSGTELIARLRAEGRLLGDYRSYGYVMKQIECEMLFRIMRVSFHERAFAFDSLPNKLISLSFARQLHDFLLPDERTRAHSSAIQQLIVDARKDTLDELQLAIDFVQTNDVLKRESVTEFARVQAIRMGKSTAKWKSSTDYFWTALQQRGQSHAASHTI